MQRNFDLILQVMVGGGGGVLESLSSMSTFECKNYSSDEVRGELELCLVYHVPRTVPGP